MANRSTLAKRPPAHATRVRAPGWVLCFLLSLSVVFAAMAVSHYIEKQTGWSIKKFVRTALRYCTVKIQTGNQTLTAADPLSDNLRDAIVKINDNHAH